MNTWVWSYRTAADLGTSAWMTSEDPEAWWLGCWASNVRGCRSIMVVRLERQHPCFDPRSHIDLERSCRLYSRRSSAVWEMYAPCLGSVWIRDGEQWNEAAEKRVRQRDWSSNDGGVRKEAAIPADQVCHLVVSFPACGVRRPPSRHWFDSSWSDGKAERRYCGRTTGTGAPLFSPCLQSPKPAQKESYRLVSNIPKKGGRKMPRSAARPYHTPLRCIGPIFTTCRNFSLFKIPSRRPLVIPATLRSLVPLII